MTKKLFSALLIAVFMIAMAGAAWASSLSMTAPAYTVGSEWLQGQAGAINVDLGDACPSPGTPLGSYVDYADITYTPSIDMGVNNVLVVKVTNGALAPNTSYALWDVGGAGKVADLVDFIADGSGNYTTLKFKFTATVAVGTVLTFTEDGLLPAAGNAPELVSSATQLMTGAMTLQVTEAYDDTSLPLQAPLTPAAQVLRAVAQLSAGVTQASSVIDVESTPSRSKFVQEPGGDTPTTTSSRATVRVYNATVNQGLVLNSNDTYTITVNGNQTAISNVSLPAGATVTEGANSWTIQSDFGANNLVGGQYLTINVDGVNIVDTATYTINLVIDPDEAGVATQTALDDQLTYTWTVNAMQAKVPYLYHIPGATWDSIFKVVNEGAAAASISVDAIIQNVTDGVFTNPTNVDFGTVNAGETKTFNGEQMVANFGLDSGKMYHFSLTVTVVGPQNGVHMVAQHKSDTGRANAPVLYNTRNANDGRVWQ